MRMPTLDELSSRLHELGFYDPSNPDIAEVGRAVKRYQIANSLVDGDPNGFNVPINHGVCCHITQKALWPEGL